MINIRNITKAFINNKDAFGDLANELFYQDFSGNAYWKHDDTQATQQQLKAVFRMPGMIALLPEILDINMRFIKKSVDVVVDVDVEDVEDPFEDFDFDNIPEPMYPLEDILDSENQEEEAELVLNTSDNDDWVYQEWLKQLNAGMTIEEYRDNKCEFFTEADVECDPTRCKDMLTTRGLRLSKDGLINFREAKLHEKSKKEETK